MGRFAPCPPPPQWPPELTSHLWGYCPCSSTQGFRSWTLPMALLGPLPSLLPGRQAGPLQYSKKRSSVPFKAFKVAYGSSYLSLPTTDSFPSPKPQLVIFPRENNSGFLKKPLQRIQSPLRVLPWTRGHFHAHGWLPASALQFLHPHLPGAWVRSD